MVVSSLSTVGKRANEKAVAENDILTGGSEAGCNIDVQSFFTRRSVAVLCTSSCFTAISTFTWSILFQIV